MIRMRRWEVLARTARSGASRRGPVLEIRYRAGPGVRMELADLLSAERRDCPFLSWSLHHDGRHVVVRISAGPEHPDDIAAIALVVGARPA